MFSTGHSWLKRSLFLTLGIFLLLPTVVIGQGQGRGKPSDVFVNGHDARDGRWDRDDQRRGRRDDDDWDRNGEDRRRGRRRRGNDDYPNWGGGFQLRQTALNAGYNNGIEEGRKDRQRRERFDYRDEGDYQKATKDYSSRLGDRELYRRYFREAFVNGYEAGYNGY